MAESRSAAAEPEPDPLEDGWLGDFTRGPAVFAVFCEGMPGTTHPLLAPEYRIECNDGAGPRVICRFFDEPEADPEWFGAWRNDEWCAWILGNARRLIAAPEHT
jgi:hypothetical protein